MSELRPSINLSKHTDPTGVPPRVKQYLGLRGGAKGWVSSQVAESHRKVLVISPHRSAAEALEDDIRFFGTDKPISSLSAWDTLPFEAVSPQVEVTALRIKALHELWNAPSCILVASADALLQRVVDTAYLRGQTRELQVQSRSSRPELLNYLDHVGYRRVSIVEEVGDYTVRGGVVDLYPATTQLPVRLEFAGDVVEHIRSFDLDSQRSVGALERVLILPVREIRRGTSNIPEALVTERIRDRGIIGEVAQREVARIIQAVRDDAEYPGLELHQPLFHGISPALHETLPPDTLIVMENEIALEQELESCWQVIIDRHQRAIAEQQLVPAVEDLYTPPTAVLAALSMHERVILESLEGQPAANREVITVRTDNQTELITKLKTKVGTGNALTPLRQAITKWRKQGDRVAFAVGTRQRGERLHRLLLDLTIDAPMLDAIPVREWCATSRWPVAILQGHLSAGFRVASENIVFIAEHEVFAERSYRGRAARRSPSKRLLGILSQLKEGDYLVHVDYGIGVYRGLRHMKVEGQNGDFLQIEYADSQLYLPVQLISKVQKFVATEGAVPQLDKLGSQRWVKTKIKVRESVASLAGDLIQLYATRSVAKGWRFEPLGAEDERFADGFPYQETDDQQKAINETINDMAKDTPMDRLVCGDVGFGKTEVALRAAFKCTQHARQVAVLAPTTILVEQHLRNFQERFLGYPIQIAAVSRFHEGKENRRALERLANGELDIVIGTHRLLQRDVLFKDLGLVIVDEEHRFGVKQKERLKQLKKQVDVLTLTATPIPRTLHMALLGLRDISLISTPPTDRRVIRTYVAERNDSLIRDAILREIQRGGQVFFLSNKITGMDILTAELQRLVPEARFAFGHGQMSEHQLEGIMKRFIDREIDVLVATTIIESGIDIPNANTIIIDRADTLGLAQLYQIRGRVGRSTKQAYAYLMIPHPKKLKSDAQQRLRALQALDDLGLGFNLSLADMEIRGAGNLLGKEQSGSVLSVGFELYTKILREAVMNLKGEQIPLEETVDPEIKLPIEAFIPDHYVPDISERLIMYQRLGAMTSDEEGRELLEEMRDRFGPIDTTTEAYVELMQFRAVLRKHGFSKCEFGNGRLYYGLSPQAPVQIDQILKLVDANPGRYNFTKNLTIGVTLTPQETPSVATARDIAERLISRIKRLPAT